MNNYRVLFLPALEKSAIETYAVPASSKSEAQAILDAIANYTLHLHEKELMHDYSNFGCIEQFVDGEWQEMEDERI